MESTTTSVPGSTLAPVKPRLGPTPAPLQWTFHGLQGGLRWSAETEKHRFHVHAIKTEHGCHGGLLRIVRVDDGELVIHQYTRTTEDAVDLAAWLQGGE